MIRLLKWMAHEAWEKINVVNTWREIKELGRKHGKRMFWVALIWECIEDGLFPLLAWWFGVPALIPLFLIFHFEPIAYPAIFWGLRMWDRSRGRVPWGPPRPVQSSYWRTGTKMLTLQIAVSGWLAVLLFVTLGGFHALFPFYLGLMTVFCFIHERVWHDSNYGIQTNDQVDLKRTLAKAATYRVVSALVFYSALSAMIEPMPWGLYLAYQGVELVVYLLLELVWSRSTLGLAANRETTPCPSTATTLATAPLVAGGT